MWDCSLWRGGGVSYQVLYFWKVTGTCSICRDFPECPEIRALKVTPTSGIYHLPRDKNHFKTNQIRAERTWRKTKDKTRVADEIGWQSQSWHHRKKWHTEPTERIASNPGGFLFKVFSTKSLIHQLKKNHKKLSGSENPTQFVSWNLTNGWNCLLSFPISGSQFLSTQFDFISRAAFLLQPHILRSKDGDLCYTAITFQRRELERAQTSL